MTHKSLESYEKLLRHINKLASDINISLNPKCVLTYFELAAIQIPDAWLLIKPTFPCETEEPTKWFESTYVIGKKRRRNQYDPKPKYSPSMWSVYDSMKQDHPRTQNKIESWHNRWRELPTLGCTIYSLNSKKTNKQCDVIYKTRRLVYLRTQQCNNKTVTKIFAGLCRIDTSKRRRNI